MPAGDGFRIPVVLDFSQSLQNVQSFRRKVEQELIAAARRGGTTESGASARAITGQLAQVAAAGRAAVVGGPSVPEQAKLTQLQRSQLAALEREVREQAQALGVRAPSEAEIKRSQPKAYRDLEVAQRRQVAAAQRAAKAAEREAEVAERRAARAAQRPAGAIGPHAVPTVGPTQIGELFGIPGGVPGDNDLRQLRAALAAAEAQGVFPRLGEKAGIGRSFGLQTGLAEENDPTFSGAENQALRLQLTIARRIRELDERSDVENALITAERAVLRKTAQLAVLLETRNLEQRAQQRAETGTSLDGARAADRLAGERDRARVTGRVAADTTPEIARELGASRAQQRARARRIERAALREEAASEELTKAAASVLVARRRQQRAINDAAQAEARATRTSAGTPVQRLQGFIAQRSGGPPRDPTEFLTGRQLLASRALTTASFAASGALLYGGLQFAKELVTEATALQVQLNIVKSQLQEAGDVGGRSFAEIREEIISVSRETGVMANKVALVGRQLAGAFADESGVPDYSRGLTEARSGLQLGRITNIPEQEITDSLTAISLAFAQTTKDGEALPFEDIGDQVIGLAQRFGVTESEIVRFTADLAPLGAELGFTVAQLSALGAVAQQTSGRTGTVLAEQFGRILPALADRSADLLILFQENEKTAAQIPSLSRALATRDLPKVLTELVKGYENFTAAQQNSLVSLVGSRREAGSFYALLTNGEKTVAALNIDPSKYAGAQAKRFEDFSETVQFAFERAERAIEDFGITLFNAGLADGLIAVGRGLEFVASGAGLVLDIVGQLNQMTDGWVGKLAGVALALLALNKTLTITANAYKAVAASQVLATLTAGGGFAGRAVTAGPGGVAGPLRGAPLFARGPGALLGGGGAAIGGSAGAFIAANGVGLTILAGAIVKTVHDKGKEDLASAVDFLRKQTRDALERGVDPAELQRIAEAGESDLGAFDRLNLFIHGQPTSQVPVVQKEINEFYGDLRKRQLELIRKQLGDIEVQTKENSPTSGFGAEFETLTAEFIADFAADPHGLTEEALKFIEAAGAKDPEVKAALDKLIQQDTADRKALNEAADKYNKAAEFVSDPKSGESLEALRDAVAAGSTVPGRLIDALKRHIEERKVLVARLRALAAAEEDEDVAINLLRDAQGLQGEVDSLTDELQSVSQAAITDPANLRIRIRESLNLKGADEANLADIKGVVTSLEGLDTKEQLEQVFRGIELLSKMAEAAGRTTFEVPPEWQVIIARANVPTFTNTQDGQKVASLLGTGIDNLANMLVAAITQVGLDANKISESLVVARRMLLYRSLQAAQQVSDWARIIGIVGELEGLDLIESQISGLVTGLTGINLGSGNVSGEDPDDIARQLADAHIAVARAQANGDPVRLAQLARDSANVAIRFAKNAAERVAGYAALIEADNQLRDALAEIPQAMYELAQAMSANDAVKVTDYAADAANAAVANAKGTAARIRAEAAKVNADRAARDAIRDVFTAQQELLIAIANAAGDTVGAATHQLAIAKANLKNLIKEGGGKAEIARATAEVVSAQAAVRDARFQDQLGDVDFLLEMERISVQQAIGMLERIAQIPGLTEEMLRTIERRIKQLRDEVNGDLAFNIPDIRLPTLYEVRRLMQSGSPGGTGGYQDNRIVTMGNIMISTEVDAQAFLADLADIVGAPPTNGTYAGIY